MTISLPGRQLGKETTNEFHIFIWCVGMSNTFHDRATQCCK